VTLGTGIFLAALIIAPIYLYNSTKDRWDWSKGMKRIGLFFVGLAVLGGGFALYDEYGDKVSVLPIQKEKLTSQTEFWGVKLGATEEDVLFLKGNPQSKGVNLSGHPYWAYTSQFDGSRSVYFTKDKKVRGVLLYKGDYSDGKVLGVHIGYTLNKLEEKLGPPDKINSSEDNTTRWYLYHTYNAEYALRKAVVSAVGISNFGITSIPRVETQNPFDKFDEKSQP
jgi:hypothetical protein